MFSVVRHKAVSNSSFETTDKFRVDTFIGNKLVGQKQILSSVVKNNTPPEVSAVLANWFVTPRNYQHANL